MPALVGAQTPRRGGTFRIRGEDAVMGFDPHLAVNHHRIGTNLSFTHSRLVKVKAGSAVRPGTLPIEPDLAESWTQPSETTYVFHLRKGVRWHPKPPVNGRELTAEDVKFTYDRFRTVKGNPNRGMLEQIQKIEALDRYAQSIPEAKRLLAQAGLAGGVKVPLEATPGWSPDYVDILQIVMKNWKAAGIDTELKQKEFAAFMSSTIFGRFDKLAHSLRGGTPVADLTLYSGHIPGEPLNSSGVNDPKLTEMIRLQRRTFDVVKRREILYDIQRYLAEQVYYVYGPSFSTVSAWAPYVKNFAPNLGHDYGGRLMVAWLEK